MESNTSKWIWGILASVLASLIVWYITDVSEIFKKEEIKSPDLKIVKFILEPERIHVGRASTIDLDVFNQGNAIASDCKVQLKIGNRIFGENQFSLAPDERRNVVFELPKFNEAGKKDAVVQVTHANSTQFLEKPLELNVEKCADSLIQISNIGRRLNSKANQEVMVVPVITNKCFVAIEKAKLFLFIKGPNLPKNGIAAVSKEINIAGFQEKYITLTTSKTLSKGLYSYELVFAIPDFSFEPIKGLIRVY